MIYFDASVRVRNMKVAIREVLNKHPEVSNEDKILVLTQLAKESEEDTVLERNELLRKVVNVAANGVYCLLCGEHIKDAGHASTCLVLSIEKTLE